MYRYWIYLNAKIPGRKRHVNFLQRLKLLDSNVNSNNVLLLNNSYSKCWKTGCNEEYIEFRGTDRSRRPFVDGMVIP